MACFQKEPRLGRRKTYVKDTIIERFVHDEATILEHLHHLGIAEHDLSLELADSARASNSVV